MKRIISLLLIACLLLSGCAGPGSETTGPSAEAPSTQATTEATEAPTTEPVTEPTAEPTTEPTTEPATEPPVLYRHPMTGELLDAPWTGRATAVVINNLKNALPQHGVADADFLFEAETEGGITRMLAIYSDMSQIGPIGPIRSARTFFNNIALSYNAPLVHCGGSDFALRGQYSSSKDTISGWQHTSIDSVHFYRDQDRKNAGYAYEHTLFSSGDLLTQLMAKKGWNTETPEGTSYGFAFDENVELDGDSAGSITVTFNGDKTTTMEYDINGGVYLASQYGSPYVDGNTGAQLEFKNVIVIYTAHTFQRDSFYRRSFYDLDGSGKGYFACNGQIVPITWHRDSLRSSFYYTLEDGTPITLGVGKTYVAIVSDQKTIAYDPLPVPDDWLRNDA